MNWKVMFNTNMKLPISYNVLWKNTNVKNVWIKCFGNKLFISQSITLILFPFLTVCIWGSIIHNEGGWNSSRPGFGFSMWCLRCDAHVLCVYRVMCCWGGGSDHASVLPFWRHSQHRLSYGIHWAAWVSEVLGVDLQNIKNTFLILSCILLTQTSAPGLAPTATPRSNAFKYFVFPIHLLNDTHTTHIRPQIFAYRFIHIYVVLRNNM